MYGGRGKNDGGRKKMKERSGTVKTAKKERGSTLILTLLMIFTVTILLFANATIIQTYLKLSTETMNGVVAENAATAGIARSLYELEKSPDWAAGFTKTPMTMIPEASFIVTFDAGQNAIPYSTNAFGSGAAKKGYGGRMVPPGFAHIVSVGYYLNQQKTSEAMVRLRGFYPFGGTGLFSDTTGMRLPNLSISDSWDSNDGAYAATRSNADGTIGSNTTDHGGVTLGITTKIYGDIDIGPGGIPSAVVRALPTQYNTVSNLDSPVNMPPINIPDLGAPRGNVTVPRGASVTLPPGEYGDLTINNGSVLVLEDGSYSFGRITANYNAHANPRVEPIIEAAPANDPVIIYTSGDVNLGKADLVNMYQNSRGAPVPSHLQIYCASTTHRVDLRCGTSLPMGNAGTYFVMYAPNATVYLNGNRQNSALYGALAAEQIRGARGARAYFYSSHYDRALRSFKAPDGLVPSADCSLRVEAEW
jgi:hypothetical protein